MRVGGEVTVAGTSDPDPEPGSVRAAHARVLLRFSGMAAVPASP